MENQISGIAEEFLSPQERSRLVGICSKLTGNPDVAEDLTQETLFLAWHRMETLRDPAKRVQWIAGIARNVSLDWLRQHGREMAHSIELPQSAGTQEALTLEELVSDEFDLEVELERKELIDLLERALALLPKETRTILIKRYIEESPLAEIAGQLGTNTSTVAMRLQRGKLALRKVLTSDMQQEILTYQTNATAQMWERTSLWCHLCGNHRLLGKKQPDRGLLYLKCPACSPDDEVLSKNESVPFIKGIKSFKPAYGHLMEWCHTYYRRGLHDGSVTCDTCGRAVPAKISMPEEIRGLPWLNEDSPKWVWRQSERLVNIVCSHCLAVNCISLEGLVLALPEGREFLHARQRIRLLPYHSIEFAGRPAIVTTFESVTDTTRFEVISDDETYAVLKMYGGGK
jgi:RNA polymerase sigma factor (sigma-70 family)